MSNEVVVTIENGVEVYVIESFEGGGGGNYIAGAGLSLTGNSFDIGSGTGIIVGTDTVSVDPAVVGRKVTFTVGDGVHSTFTVDHNLGNEFPLVSVRDAITGEHVFVDNHPLNANTVELNFGAAPTVNSYKVFVIG